MGATASSDRQRFFFLLDLSHSHICFSREKSTHFLFQFLNESLMKHRLFFKFILSRREWILSFHRSRIMSGMTFFFPLLCLLTNNLYSQSSDRQQSSKDQQL